MSSLYGTWKGMDSVKLIQCVCVATGFHTQTVHIKRDANC